MPTTTQTAVRNGRKTPFNVTYRISKQLDREVEKRCFQLDIWKSEALRQAWGMWLEATKPAPKQLSSEQALISPETRTERTLTAMEKICPACGRMFKHCYCAPTTEEMDALLTDPAA